MAHPTSRRNDDIENTPRKRRGEIYVHIPERIPVVGGFEFAASGSTVILSLLAMAAFGYGFFHDQRVETEHKAMVKAQLIGICVLSLTAEEKVEYRKYGFYCWDPDVPTPFFVGRTK